MAGVVKLILQLDDQGAVKGFEQIDEAAQKLDPAFQKVGARGNVVLTSLTKQQNQARDATALFARTLGLELPRQLEKVIAKSSLLGPAMSAAFSVAVIGGFAFAIIGLIQKIPELTDKIFDWSGALKANLELEKDLNKELLESGIRLRELQEQYRLIGLEGLPRFSESQKIAAEQVAKTRTELENALKTLERVQKQAAKTRLTLGQTGNVGLVEEFTPGALEAQKRLPELNRNVAKLAANLREVEEKARGAGKELSVAFSKEAKDQIAAAAQVAKQAGEELERGAVQRGQAEQQAIDQLKQARSQAQAAGLSGEQAILEKLDQEIAKIKELASQFPRSAQVQADAQKAITAAMDAAAREQSKIFEDQLDSRGKAEDDAQNDRIAANRQGNDAIRDAETELQVLRALLAGDTVAAIEIQENERVEKTLEGLARIGVGEEQLAQLRVTLQAQANARIVQEMSSEMERLFDDITSGNIGKRFLSMFKKLVFQMIATWILGLNRMRAATAGGLGAPGSGGGFGGILGGILGGIFGGGGGGFGLPGSGPGGTPPFIGSNFLGGGLGFGSVLSGGGSAGSLGGGLGLTPPFSGGGGAGLGTTLPAGAALGAGAGRGGLLGALGPAALPLLLGLGLVGSQNRALRGIGGFFTGGGIGLALGGAGLGLIGGALGAFLPIIGAFIGLFAGLFLHRSTKKARLRIEEDVKRQAQQIEDAYKVFQTDYGSAIQQLEQVRQEGVDALRRAGVKDINRSRVGHVDWWVDQAEKQINAIEAERQRRGQLVFGPAQFHEGGMVTSLHAARSPALPGFPSFDRGGQVNANLLVGEGVLTRRGMRAVGGEAGLNRINTGGGGEVHLHINAIDAKSFAQWLRAGGLKEILRETHRAQLEGAA